MRYEMSAYVAACALKKPNPANFSTSTQVSSRCWLVSPIIPTAFRNFPRNRSRSLRPENFADARRTRSASASDMLPSVCEICITCSWKIHTPSVSPRIGLSFGCADVISFSLRSLFTNNHLDPAERFDAVHIVLRHDNSFCGALQRRQPRQRTRRNHCAARMNPKMPRCVIETQRHLQNRFPGLIFDRQVTAFRQRANGLQKLTHRAVPQP